MLWFELGAIPRNSVHRRSHNVAGIGIITKHRKDWLVATEQFQVRIILRLRLFGTPKNYVE
jgi:hypothetical protein